MKPSEISFEYWSLSGLLEIAYQQHGHRPFLLDQGCHTYQKIYHLSCQLASYLENMGMAKGDRAIIISDNRWEVVVALFGVLRLRGVFTILHPFIKAGVLCKIFGQLMPKFIFADENGMNILGDVEDESHFCGVHRIGFGDCCGHKGWMDFQKTLSNTCPNGIQNKPLCIDQDTACVIYTSGSSGEPAGIVMNHDNIMFATTAIQQRLQYAHTDRIGLYLPMAFDYGLYQIFLAMVSGASVYFGNLQSGGIDMISELSANRISVLPVVPTLAVALLRLMKRNRTKKVGLRLITNTGEHLPNSCIEGLKSNFPKAKLFVMYGLTECKRVSILMPEELAHKHGSVGRPIPGTEVIVVDDKCIEQRPFMVGEFAVKGRHVGRGYLFERKNSSIRFDYKVLDGMWLFTGDYGYIDDEGYLFFIGRNDDLIKKKGFRISGIEIESVAVSIEGIGQAALIQSDRGHLHLFVVAGRGEPQDKKWVLAKLSERLEDYKLPDQIHFLRELPLTERRKVDRSKLKFLANEKSP